MPNNLLFWSETESVDVAIESSSVVQIANIENHVYILTNNNELHHGRIQLIEGRKQLQLSHYDGVKVTDIADCGDYLFLVDVEGAVSKLNRDLEIVEKHVLKEDSKTCIHGRSRKKLKRKALKIAAGKFGLLILCENGQLWGMGQMPQIALDSNVPKKIGFFEDRITYDISVGDDLALVIVSKQSKNEDTDSDDFEEYIFVPNCPCCISLSHSNESEGQNCNRCSLKDNADSSSTSSKNDTCSSTTSNDKSKHIHYDQTSESSDSSYKIEKNIIFRNTEAARDFLARKISWMSSAGEEYLAECTEKPTRIIKENMTNVASFVKTVGDKVATLSRHVSGSSDTADAVELSAIHNSISKEDFSCSLSVGTSEKEMSEQCIREKCNTIVNFGNKLINCEVWTWGNVDHGQLGIGDGIRRERPMIVSRLSNIGSSKTSSKSSHAGVVTLDGRAFLWGKNDFNQVTCSSDSDQSSPRQFHCLNGDRIRDVSCGNSHFAILSSKLVLQYLGKSSHNEKKPVSLCSSLSNKEMLNSLELGNRNTDNDKQIRNEVLTSGDYTLLNKHSYGKFFIAEWLMQEQQFLENLLSSYTKHIKVLQKKTFSPEFQVVEDLIASFTDILYFTAASVHSFLEFTKGLICDNDIIFFKCVDEHLYIFKRYFEAINSIIILDGFSYLSKISDNNDNTVQKKVVKNKKDRNGEKLLENALKLPLQRLELYEAMINTFLSLHKDPKMADVLIKWKSAIEEQEIKLEEAENTKQFWKDSDKSLLYLRKKNRRLIRDSRKYPIHIQNASRFSSHSFVLLTDMFLHLNGTTAHPHDLNTIWFGPTNDENYDQNLICLKMPEETLMLCSNEPEEKTEWLKAIQGAVLISLKKTNINHLPAVRNAEYTFVKNGFYKDAKYKGKWLNGKLHGYGKCIWTDGRTYTGQFSNNSLHGIGSMEIPNLGVYEGQWKDNQQNGLGVLKYDNGSVYKGWFRDGQAYGHGILQNGKFMASDASIYVGDWINGSKSGYGVMDNITAGEKYLGNWSDNKKHGNGLIVTSDGVYYEGNFNQDVFAGTGLMILEDGTHYQGEFKGIGHLCGKGTLTLNSGHAIEGNLSGSLNEGIKISNGFLSLMKNNVDSSKTPQSFYKYCTPVTQKWKALFQHCYQCLGVNESTVNTNPPDIQKIWQNIAVAICTSYSNSLKMNKGNRNERASDISLNNLDTIPDFGRSSIDGKTYSEIKLYLKKAFQSPHHPLGSLLSHVTVAYTTTYGGPTAHALLLTHAVEELHSITKRLYDVIKLLFPALPCNDKEISVDDTDREIINYHSLLYPIILPKVYSQLFILYTLHNKAQDIQYWKRLIEWNKHPDFTLLAYLSVDRKFLQISNSDQSLLTSVRDESFVDAVETLQLLKTTFSPLDKLLKIRESFKKIVTVMQELLGQDYNPTMDDLFPVFLYVVVRARILQLGSEIHFIEDFMEPSLENGELGLMFTTLHACYQQILQEKTIID